MLGNKYFFLYFYASFDILVIITYRFWSGISKHEVSVIITMHLLKIKELTINKLFGWNGFENILKKLKPTEMRLINLQNNNNQFWKRTNQ